MTNPPALARVFPQVAARPLVIAGPCSAESREQVLATARGLAAAGVRIFRAGVWKPRTQPGAFEGRGSEALAWLAEARRETGMLVATEVANARHVAEALAAAVDVVWIGARTTVNTFAVEEIASALRGTDLPVLVKNPVSPDLALWIGAHERLRRAGLRRLAAVHRGFSSETPSRYRNDPRWQIPIELAARLPDVPVLCDPSHLAGDRRLLRELCQAALDLGFDGLMIESHVDPARALSDAKQQIAPAELAALLARLVQRSPDAPEEAYQRRLSQLRHTLDGLDGELLAVLARRMRVAEDIGRLKKEVGVLVLQRERWEHVVAGALQTATALGLTRGFLERVFAAIHEESIARQTRVMSGEPEPPALPPPAPGVPDD